MLFGNIDIATFTTLLAGVPDSVGVLVFGLGFTSFAILMRRLLQKNESTEVTENTGKDA